MSFVYGFCLCAFLPLGTCLQLYLTRLFLQWLIQNYPPSHARVYSQMERHVLSLEKTQSAWQKVHSNLSPQARATVTNVCPWSVVTVANLEAHSRMVRSPMCSILSQSLTALLECIRSHLSHVARTDPAPEVSPLRSVFMNAWATVATC